MRMKPLYEAEAKARQISKLKYQKPSLSSSDPNDVRNGTANEIVGEMMGVSPATVKRETECKKRKVLENESKQKRSHEIGRAHV